VSQPHKLVLLGFSSFEKVTFESFFRLAARRPPGYVLVDDASQADLAVINADDAALLKQYVAAQPAQKVLLIGAQDGGTGWALQRRPLNLMKVLATIETLFSDVNAATVPSTLSDQITANPSQSSDLTQSASTSALQAGVKSRQTNSEAQRLGTMRSRLQPSDQESDTGSDSLRRNSIRTGTGSLPKYENSSTISSMPGFDMSRPAPESSAGNIDHILVVDDSDIALKFMRNRLSRFGFHADLVNSGEEALGKMNTKPYKFVFLDVMMEGLDGYQTCRAIKQRKYSDGKPPVVVMLTSRGGTIDKIRGTLAGCDAYLTKPLNERDLIAVLAKHDRNVARGFQQTNFGSNSSGFAKTT
jgi:two-component system, cell cycle response regulator